MYYNFIFTKTLMVLPKKFLNRQVSRFVHFDGSFKSVFFILVICIPTFMIKNFYTVGHLSLRALAIYYFIAVWNFKSIKRKYKHIIVSFTFIDLPWVHALLISQIPDIFSPWKFSSGHPRAIEHFFPISFYFILFSFFYHNFITYWISIKHIYIFWFLKKTPV